MQNIGFLLGEYQNFGEFLGDYWWLFVLTILAIILLIVVIVLGVKQSKGKSTNKKEAKSTVDQQPSTKQDSKTEAKEQTITESKAQGTAQTQKATDVDSQTKTAHTSAQNKRGRPPKTTDSGSTSNSSTKSTKAKKSYSATKTKPATKTAKASSNNTTKYDVTYDKEAQNWVVKFEGSTRASKRCATKAEALAVAKSLAGKKNGSLSVRKRNGQFQKQ